MKRRQVIQNAAMIATTLLFSEGALAAVSRPMRTVLVTSGPYERYRRLFFATLTVLRDRGLVAALPNRPDDLVYGTADIWHYLSRHGNTEAITFLKDGHYDYDFDEKRRERLRAEILERLREDRDIDLILTFGTQAGIDMARNVRDIPVLSLSSSDPVANGIVKSVDDSGRANLHATVLTDFVADQVKIFHAAVGFKTLGFVYGHNFEKKSGRAEAERAAKSLGVRLLPVTFDNTETRTDAERFTGVFRAIKDAHARGIRAVMLPWFPSVPMQVASLTHWATGHGVYLYSLNGTKFVPEGLLMGAADESAQDYGLFEADVIARVLKGEAPGNLPQGLRVKARFVLNGDAARKMQWKPDEKLKKYLSKVY